MPPSRAAGFETMQQSALDVLSDLMLRYVGEIGATAHGYAELSNHTTPSADDLVLSCAIPATCLLCIASACVLQRSAPCSTLPKTLAGDCYCSMS